MPFDPDDPRLTSYALGELDPDGRSTIEAILRDDPEARSFVAGVEATARLLRDELGRESTTTPGLDPARLGTIEDRLTVAPTIPIADAPARPRPRLVKFLIAASILGLGIGLTLPAVQSARRAARRVPPGMVAMTDVREPSARSGSAGAPSDPDEGAVALGESSGPSRLSTTAVTPAPAPAPGDILQGTSSAPSSGTGGIGGTGGMPGMIGGGSAPGTPGIEVTARNRRMAGDRKAASGSGDLADDSEPRHQFGGSDVPIRDPLLGNRLPVVVGTQGPGIANFGPRSDALVRYEALAGSVPKPSAVSPAGSTQPDSKGRFSAGKSGADPASLGMPQAGLQAAAREGQGARRGSQVARQDSPQAQPLGKPDAGQPPQVAMKPGQPGQQAQQGRESKQMPAQQFLMPMVSYQDRYQQGPQGQQGAQQGQEQGQQIQQGQQGQGAGHSGNPVQPGQGSMQGQMFAQQGQQSAQSGQQGQQQGQQGQQGQGAGRSGQQGQQGQGSMPAGMFAQSGQQGQQQGQQGQQGRPQQQGQQQGQQAQQEQGQPTRLALRTHGGLGPVALNDAEKRRVEDVEREIDAKRAEVEQLVRQAEVFRKRKAFERVRGDREAYARVYDHPFLNVVPGNELSTFAVDVDTGAYANVRRFLSEGRLPPVDAVRIEEMLNYFTYDDPDPKGDDPFSIQCEVAACPWDGGHRLARIGLKGKRVDADKRPTSNLVFLIDVSGSMADANKLPLLKAGMKLLVGQLTENDRVGIVVYSNDTRVAFPSTPCHRRAEILAAIDGLRAEGGTNGGAGMRMAYAMAEENFIKGGTNRVILATDGDFNIGLTKDQLLAASAERARSGVFLTVLGFGEGNIQEDFMEQLADKGNGHYAYIDSIDEARKVLVRQMSGTLVTIAKDVKVQVEFNPDRVASYRLIGYENREMPAADFRDDRKDAGEIGAGHSVTALYELVSCEGRGARAEPKLKYRRPAAEVAAAAERKINVESFTCSLRCKRPDGERGIEISRGVVDDGRDFGRASADLRFSAAVAGFGMLLRDSPYKGALTYPAVLEIASGALGDDRHGDREEFLGLVRQAERVEEAAKRQP